MRASTRTGAALVLEPHPASIQYRDGADRFCGPGASSPFIHDSFADSGYPGKGHHGNLIAVEIVPKLPINRPSPFSRALVVERFLRLDRAHRRSWRKDFEAHNRLRQSLPLPASIMLLVRRLDEQHEFFKTDS